MRPGILQSPGNALNTPELSRQEIAQPLPVGEPVGNKVRQSQEIEQVMGHHKFQDPGQRIFLVSNKILG